LQRKQRRYYRSVGSNSRRGYGADIGFGPAMKNRFGNGIRDAFFGGMASGVRDRIADRCGDGVDGFGGRFRNAFNYSFRYSRRRRVCMRLTGISVDFASFIFRM
jgi:hypothetical protein